MACKLLRYCYIGAFGLATHNEAQSKEQLVLRAVNFESRGFKYHYDAEAV